MKRTISLAAFALTVAAAFLCGAGASAFDEFNVWPGLAPGEKEDATKPTYEYWKPEKKTSDSLMIVCPGGAYNGLAYGHEGGVIAQYFNSKGITAVVLKYRVPRREGLPKHMAAWQDAQRCVRVCRSRAKEWGIDPNKIGILGFSAGGHLTLMIATTSQTNKRFADGRRLRVRRKNASDVPHSRRLRQSLPDGLGRRLLEAAQNEHTRRNAYLR